MSRLRARALLAAVLLALLPACRTTRATPAGPQPDPCRACAAWFAGLPERFNAEAARGIRAVYLFVLTGDDGAEHTWSVTVADGACLVQPGREVPPAVTIRASCRDWLLLSSRRMSGTLAFLTGRLRIEGNRSLARHLERLFFVPEPAS
jgi:putative sterol carrier protein